MPEIKICGLTREKDVALCLELKIEYAGFIFVESSPRYVSPQSVARFPAGNIKRVGIFAGQSVKQVQAIMRDAELDMAQLHGGENTNFCAAIGVEKVIKVLWPAAYSNRAEFLADLNAFAPFCSHFLLDAGQQGGGSGHSFNWSLLNVVPSAIKWWLAGGLGLHNIHEALNYKASCLDINSAIESAPGIKEHALLRRTVYQCRNLSQGIFRT